jgi:hypothetical protein
MRSLRIVALLTLGVFGVFGVFGAVAPAPPAGAGGWAMTLLDPVPERFEAGHTYTIGYWVLQHGSHPYEGDLGRTGLRLVGPDKQEIVFDAVALREPAHYAVAIAVPTTGTWQVHAMQGWFDEHNVGTLTVPGGLAIRPPDGPVDVGGHSHDGKTSHWGAIHPPVGAAEGHSHDHDVAVPEKAAPAGNAAPAASTPQVQTPQAQSSPPLVPALLAFGVVVVLLGLALVARPLRRRLGG